VTFDAVVSDTAEIFISGLDRGDRQRFYEALDVLMSDPHPDGVTKVALPFPYTPGTFGFYYRDFWIAYVFLNALVLGVIAAHWSPRSPRYTL